MYDISATVFFITSREIERFHCQLSGGRKSVVAALKAVLGPTPATAFFRPGLIVSRLRQVGQSASVVRPPCQPVSTVTDHGGFVAIRRMSSITFARPIYRPNPPRTAVLPSPKISQAIPTRGWYPALYGLTKDRGRSPD